MMKTKSRAIEPSVPLEVVDDHPAVKALAERLPELLAQRPKLIERKLAIEAQLYRAPQTMPMAKISARARALLGGSGSPALGTAEQLAAVNDELAVLDRAIEICRSEEIRARLAAFADVRAAAMPAWRAALRRMAAAVIELEVATRSRDLLLAEICKGVPGQGLLPGCGFNFLNLHRGSSIPAAKFLQVCVDEGAIDAAERREIVGNG